MALKFRSATIPGLYESLQLGEWGVQAARTQYHGQEGESEIRGSRAGRDITVKGVWHNSYLSAATCNAAIEALNRQAPINGKIERTGLIVDSHQNCTLISVIKLLDPVYSNKYGYWTQVQIRWRQLGE